MTDLGNPILDPLNRASDAQWQPAQTSSPASTRLAKAEAALHPAEPDQILMQLMPVLALVGASGLNQSDREEWLAAATDALKDVPGDLLKAAISRARLHCDHPSKVIPFIIKDVEQAWNWRLGEKNQAEFAARSTGPALPAPGQTYCTAEEAAEIVDRVFPQARSLRDTPPPIKRGPPRMPTRADYLEMGVDPAALGGLAA